jgi:ABC-2 type transport system ATP-binding protein
MDVRRMLGFVPQQLSADAALSGRENVRSSHASSTSPAARVPASFRSCSTPWGSRRRPTRLVSTYSGGMIRRLELAQALVNRPRLLVPDEPTIGLDPIARSSVWGRIEGLRRETGMTVLLTTHYMDEADALCDRVALMHRARLRALGSPRG